MSLTRLTWLTGLALCTAPMAASGASCIYADDPSFPLKACLEPGEILSLDNLAMNKGALQYPLAKIRVDDGDELLIGDVPDFTRHIWRVRKTTSASELAHFGATRIHASVVWRPPAACLFGKAKAAEERRCIPAGERVDGLSVPGRRVSYLQVPESFSATAFTGVGDGERQVTLYRDTSIAELRKLGLDQAIRAVQVARTSVNCSTWCPLPSAEAYNLPAIFGKYWSEDAGAVAMALLMFRIDKESNLRLQLGNIARVRFHEGNVSVTAGTQPVPLVSLAVRDQTPYAVIGMAFLPGMMLAIQVYLRGTDQVYRAGMPVLQLPWGSTQGDILSIRNLSERRAAALVELTLAVAQPGSRVVREVPCGDIHVLPIQTCASPAGPAPTPTTPPLPAPLPAALPAPMIHIAGRPATPLIAGRPATPPVAGPTKALPAQAQLARTVRDGHGPAALYAAMRVCRVPIDFVLHPRMRRHPGNPADPGACMARVKELIALYQTLFPGMWTLAQFRAIIESVLQRGATGVPTLSREDERRFVDVVQRPTGTADRRLADAVAAFHLANVLQTYAVVRRLDLEAAATDAATDAASDAATEAGAAACIAPQDMMRPMSIMRTGLLGSYRLDIDEYRPIIVVPRVHRQGRDEPVDSPFSLEIISPHDHTRLASLRQTMQAWAYDYLHHTAPAPAHEAADPAAAGCPPAGGAGTPRDARMETAYTRRQFLAAAGNSIAMGIEDAAREDDEHSIYLVARLDGRPVSVLAATLPPASTTPREARIDFVVSAPFNVLFPLMDGALRGGGAYVLHAFVQLARARGVTSIRAEAATDVPLLESGRTGFRIVDDGQR